MKKIFVIISILYRNKISCRFGFHNLWRAWNRQHWLFYNLALLSINGNDGTAISTWGVIININKYRWEKVYEVNTCRKLKLRTMILFISNSWSWFFAKSLLYPHLKARYFFPFRFIFTHTEIKKLRVDIQFISWNESQTQVIHALNISLYTLKDSTFFGAQL